MGVAGSRPRRNGGGDRRPAVLLGRIAPVGYPWSLPARNTRRIAGTWLQQSEKKEPPISAIRPHREVVDDYALPSTAGRRPTPGHHRASSGRTEAGLRMSAWAPCR